LDTKKRTLELVASHGLSEKYLNKGPVDADQSIADAMEGIITSLRTPEPSTLKRPRKKVSPVSSQYPSA